MVRLYILTFLFLICLSLEAKSACVAAQVDLATIPGVTLSLSSGATTPISVNRNNTNNFCSYYVDFGGGANNLSYNPRRLRLGAGSDYVNYNIYQSSSNLTVLKVAADANSSEVITGSFANGSGPLSNAHSFFSQISESLGNAKPSGSYTDTVAVHEYFGSSTPPSGTLDRTRNVVFTLSYPVVTRISLVSTGGVYNDNSNVQNLNFGTLSTGQSLAFDILSVSNQNYSVKFSSANNGVLKHSSVPASTVSYTLNVNATPLNLSTSQLTPVTAISGAGCCTPDGGTRTPIQVVIGTIGNQLAGPYSDTITVTISSP